ncbi:hypothetical protein Leryth_015425 [Lithospermum erythrorhizon]|nr:hypothetical protein Leryth_015425 [Lithospermum erythrorhizon]
MVDHVDFDITMNLSMINGLVGHNLAKKCLRNITFGRKLEFEDIHRQNNRWEDFVNSAIEPVNVNV